MRAAVLLLGLAGACAGAPPGEPPDWDAGAHMPAVAAPQTPLAASQTSYFSAIDEPTAGQSAAAMTAEIPRDAYAEALAHAEASDHAFEQRYPLHGLAYHVLAHVRQAPRGDAAIAGYMRRGARFRAASGERGPGCEGRWYALSSGGFVCSGRGYLLGQQPPSFEPLPAPPALYDALPYRYAKTVRPGVFQFWRAPSPEEEAALAELASQLDAAASADTAEEPASPDAGAADGGVEEGPPWPDFVRMRMEPGFYISVDQSPAQSGADEAPAQPEEGFTRSVRGALVRSEALVPGDRPQGIGVVLADRPLPLGFAYRAEATLFRRDALTGAVEGAARLARFGSRFLLEGQVALEGKPYRATRDGHFLNPLQLRVAEHAKPPALVPAGARWIHVRLSSQTLVAYEGRRAVFATLVSTGKPGHETPSGVYRIHTKHVSTTMDGLDGTDEAYSIEDVPWTMYFQGNFALHAAFWHHRFGQVRSHGCINLAPADAHWLFQWTAPALPLGWHGVLASPQQPGTWVVIEE